MMDRLFGLDDEFVPRSFYWHDAVLRGFAPEVLPRIAHVLGLEEAHLQEKVGGDGQSFPSSASAYRLAVALNRVSAVMKDDEKTRSWMQGSLEIQGKWIPVVDLVLSAIGGAYVLDHIEDLLKEKWRAGPDLEQEGHGDLLGAGGELEHGREDVDDAEEDAVWDSVEAHALEDVLDVVEPPRADPL